MNIISFSSNGQNPYDGELLDHIKQANQIYTTLNNRVIRLEEVVELYKSTNDDLFAANIECNKKYDTVLKINDNLNQEIEYTRHIIKNKNIQLGVVSSAVAILITYIIIK